MTGNTRFMKKVTLTEPVDINVEELAAAFPEYSYGGPIEATKYMDAITSERITDPSNNSRMILSFDDNTGTGFTTVRSDLAADELAFVLSELPTEKFEQMQTALAGTELELPELSSWRVESFESLKAQRKAEQETLEKVKSVGQPSNRGDFTAEDARSISQQEMGYTDATSERPVLATFGAGPCVILAIHNPDTKTATLAHIDRLTELNSTDQMFYQLGKEGDSPLEVHLAGGDSSSIEMVTKLVNQIAAKDNVVIKSADIIGNGFEGKRLAIDARTGEVFTDFEVDQLDMGPNADAKMQFMPTPLQLGFDDREETREAGYATKIEAPVTVEAPKKSASSGMLASGDGLMKLLDSEEMGRGSELELSKGNIEKLKDIIAQFEYKEKGTG